LFSLPALGAEPQAVRIVHLSDLHACHVKTNPPGRFPGDPLARNLVRSLELLHQAVDQINPLRPDVVVVTGDLVDRGDDLATLREVKSELDRLESPYCPVLGDHDRPEIYAQVFPGKIDYCVDIAGWRFVALGLRRGGIPPETVKWLADVLQKSRNQKVALLTHRPLWCDPLTLQIADSLYHVMLTPAGADDVLKLLHEHAEVRMILSGHAHVGRRDKLGSLEAIWAPALVGPPHCFGLVTARGKDVEWKLRPLAPAR
jgi:3',5'-cyclic AMP phosphodiesterase CpdA